MLDFLHLPARRGSAECKHLGEAYPGFAEVNSATDDRAHMAPRCSAGCPQGWQSRPPALGFTLLPCQGLSIQGSKRESCICGFGFKSLFLRERCVCVLQALLTDIQPRGGSAVKSLPQDIFAPLILFSVFLLTPRVGNFPQPKTRQKGEGGGERCTQHTGSWAWHSKAAWSSSQGRQRGCYKCHRHLGQLCGKQGGRGAQHTKQLPTCFTP